MEADIGEAVGEDIRRLILKADEDSDGSLLLYVRIQNDRVEYSWGNRPAELDDAMLLAAILYAGREFERSRMKRGQPHEVMRLDGTAVKFKHTIAIDFGARKIRSSVPQDTSLNVLSIVVRNLSAEAAKSAPKEMN